MNVNAQSSLASTYSTRYKCTKRPTELSSSRPVVDRGAEGLRALRAAPVSAEALCGRAEDPYALLPVRSRPQQQRGAGHCATVGVADPAGAGARATDDAKPSGDDGRGGGGAADGGLGAGNGAAG